MTPAIAALLLALQAPTDAPELTSLAVLRAGDDACGLLSDPQRALLDAAIARASDDAVTSGADPDRLNTQLARQTVVPACGDRQLASLVNDHLERIDALATFTEIRFQGASRVWMVDRRPSRPHEEPRWRVIQETGARDAVFGIAEIGDDLQLTLAFNSDSVLSGAVIVARDPERQAHPVDFTAGGLLLPPGRDGASAWGASIGQTQRFVARQRLEAGVAATLAPESDALPRGFIFPPESLGALMALTPREGIAIELRDRSGDVASVIWFEVGALQAALAMQAIPLVEIEAPAQPPAP